MSENLVIKELQKQAIDSGVVHLYELEVTPGNFFRFTNQTDDDTSDLQMRLHGETTGAAKLCCYACKKQMDLSHQMMVLFQDLQ